MRNRKKREEKAKTVSMRLTRRSLVAALGEVIGRYQSLFQ